MNTWAKSRRRVKGPPRTGASAHLIQPVISIRAMQFADPAAGSNYCVLYVKSGTEPSPPPAPPAPVGSHFQGWGQANAIHAPEWEGKEIYRAAVYRNRSVSVRVKLVIDSPSTSEIKGTLLSSPALDGDPTAVTGVNTDFTMPAGAKEVWVRVDFGGKMPDEIGRYAFDATWSAIGTGFTFGDQVTKLRIYSVYDDPVQPNYDSDSDADTGSSARVPRDTVTGTDQRIDKLMRVIGGASRRHASATSDDIIDIIWKLHVGINDVSPPYFDGRHDEHITNNGRDPGGVSYPLAQQWLMWVSPKANLAPDDDRDVYWNDGSCIGHVQLLKTMAASVGLFTRRTWVFPYTTKLPNGSTVAYADTDLYALGNYSDTKVQTWTFPKVSPAGQSPTIEATAILMEHDGGGENFEACCRSPNGRFLPGGYATSTITSPLFLSQRGFASALEVLRWWGRSTKKGFRRFQCWLGWETIPNPAGTSPAFVSVRRYWDVDGNPYRSPGVPYDNTTFALIRDRKKDLPLP
ncbi:MAG: hypothetical protein JW751_19865 [Polyangiaceae bacterium]|nr:hypothetical protein [Polyangiaceae bacterium]